MSFTPIIAQSESSGPNYTNLFACISEEDDSYTVQVRLYSQVTPDDAAWGEEMTDSLETACTMITTLAAAFSIGQARIKIEIRMRDPRGGTRH
jgi:hypothetical protein